MALVLPEVSTTAMGVFLAELSRAIPAGSHAGLVLDGAGWHVSEELVVPANLTLIHLPPYSPELNPVEKGTSEDEVPLTPRLGHAALLALARWMAERHVQVETTTSLLAGSAARPTAAVDGADRQADLPASRGVAPGGGP